MQLNIRNISVSHLCLFTSRLLLAANYTVSTVTNATGCKRGLNRMVLRLQVQLVPMQIQHPTVMSPKLNTHCIRHQPRSNLHNQCNYSVHHFTFWISLSLSEIAEHTNRPQGVSYHGYLHVLKFLLSLYLKRKA